MADIISGGAAAGLTPGSVTVTGVSSTTSVGKEYNYQVIVQVPVPFINLNIQALLGNFVLAQFTQLSIPKAMLNLLTNARDIFKTVVEDAQKIIRAIPEASVNIVVRVGQMTILNIILVAKKTPVVITPPSFELALPNLAVDGNLNFSIPFPVGDPIRVEVPIPYPVYNDLPLLTVSGGQINVTAGTSISQGALGAQASGGAATSEASIGGGTNIDSIFGSAGAGAGSSSGTLTAGGVAGVTIEGSGSASGSQTTSGMAGSGARAVAYPQDINNYVSMPSI